MGASITPIEVSMFMKLSIGAPKLTSMWLLMADVTVTKLIGVLQDFLVKLEVVAVKP